jgi:hypothetical protein
MHQQPDCDDQQDGRCHSSNKSKHDHEAVRYQLPSRRELIYDRSDPLRSNGHHKKRNALTMLGAILVKAV